MKIQPRGSYLVLEIAEAPAKMHGIHIPEESQKKAMNRPIGKIVARGPDVKAEDLQPGTVIAYQYGEREIIAGLDMKLFTMVKEEHVIGVVTEDEWAPKDKLEDLDKKAKAARMPRLTVPTVPIE